MENMMQGLTEDIIRIDEAYDRWAKAHGISYSTLMVLCCLSDKGPCAQKTIATYCSLPKQTVNTVLGSFKQKGYITLTASEQDRREKLVGFSEDGKRYADPIVAQIGACEQRALECMEPEDRAHLARTAHLFADYFDEAIDGE